MRPLHDRVLVKRLEEGEQKRGGIIIPDTAKEKPQQAQVKAVGNGKLLETGERVPPEVKPGDRHYLDYVMPPGNLQRGVNGMLGPSAPAGFQNPNWPLLGPFEAPDPYRVGW